MFQHPNLLDAWRRFQKKIHRSILNFQIYTSELPKSHVHSLKVHRRFCFFAPNLIHFHFSSLSQSVAAAMSFVYSSHIGLTVQMAILVFTGTIGTVAFYTVEWAERRKQMMKNEMIKSSDSNIVPS
jgi:uncharacterized membrane protein